MLKISNDKLSLNDCYLNVLSGLFESIIPKTIVNPQLNELQWWLGAKRVLSGHVEVVHKSQQLFATNRNIDTLGKKKQ